MFTKTHEENLLTYNNMFNFPFINNAITSISYIKEEES